LVEQRTENPRVDGSIPSLATTPKFLIHNVFRPSPAGHPCPSMVHPRTIRNWFDAARAATPAGRRGWRSGTWRGSSGGAPGGGVGAPAVPPEWAGAGRSGAGHGGGDGRPRRAAGGAREVSSLRTRAEKPGRTTGNALRRLTPLARREGPLRSDSSCVKHASLEVPSRCNFHKTQNWPAAKGRTQWL
jgi:hypothetical protein